MQKSTTTTTTTTKKKLCHTEICVIVINIITYYIKK